MNRDGIVSGLFAFLLVNMLAVTFTIQHVESPSVIHIENDASTQNMNEIKSSSSIHNSFDSTYQIRAIQDDTRSTVLAAPLQQVFGVRTEFGKGPRCSIVIELKNVT